VIGCHHDMHLGLCYQRRIQLSTCLFVVFNLNQKVGTTKDTFSDPALNLIFPYEPQGKTSPIFWMIHSTQALSGGVQATSAELNIAGVSCKGLVISKIRQPRRSYFRQLFFDDHLITELTIKFRHAYLSVHHPVDTSSPSPVKTTVVRYTTVVS